MRLLSSDEEEYVHDRTLDVLDEIGVLVRSEPVLSMLGDAGASVDERSHVAKMPEDMVKSALRDAPTTFRLCARVRGNDIELPAPRGPNLTTDGLTLYMHDDRTGAKRNATKSDYAKFTRLADALEVIDFFWPIVTISDVPPASHNLHELWTAFQNCSMHVQGDCTSAHDAKKMVELGTIIAGGKKELRKRPLFSCATNPISPLSFDEGAVEAQVELAKAGIPILCHSMSVAGLSSPVTLAGTIVNINAENLASIVISQTACSGAPHIYGSCSAPADMRSGTVDFYAPEAMLISVAAGQMARRYGRPCMVASWGMGGRGPGSQLSLSEAFAYASSAFGGSDLISGIGGLDHAKGCSMAQMVLDSTAWTDLEPFLRDFVVDEHNVALDVMKEVGHGRSFLSHPHTVKNFRNSLNLREGRKSSLRSFEPDERWKEAGTVSRNLLKDHHVEPLENRWVKAGNKVLGEVDRQLSTSRDPSSAPL